MTEDKITNSDEKANLAQEVASLKSIYEISIETRNFEISQLINRNNFFMLFQSVLLASIMQEQLKRPFVEFMVCLTGVFISYYQLQMSSGAKFWQEWWESRVLHFEKILCEKLNQQHKHKPYKLFSATPDEIKQDVSKNLSGSGFINYLVLQRHSVSRAPIKVSLVLLIVWTLLLISTLNYSYISNITLISGFK